MIVKDVDMDENGNKTYVFGTDELLLDAIDALKAFDDAAKNSTTIIGFAGKALGLVQKARVVIARYESKDEPPNGN